MSALDNYLNNDPFTKEQKLITEEFSKAVQALKEKINKMEFEQQMNKIGKKIDATTNTMNNVSEKLQALSRNEEIYHRLNKQMNADIREALKENEVFQALGQVAPYAAFIQVAVTICMFIMVAVVFYGCIDFIQNLDANSNVHKIMEYTE